VIYLDSSLVLAAVFTEKKEPPRSFWNEQLVSSRLLEYETINRVYTRGLGLKGLMLARVTLANLTFFDMSPQILARSLEPFPVAVRTLDGLHLATMDFLRAHGQTLHLATYDRRLAAAAAALGFPLAEL
jgi:predicted nucleic acid-binding protein